ncbi:hypothetical protein [Nocardia neocaledoniensis]|uniref:hypothetical protein n=1 Tax=Nocardia neocaledoniensis TaxID=236511 RepID=UPI002454D505|nr:hypothetical protein [Nocardia neocaledoniensis]
MRARAALAALAMVVLTSCSLEETFNGEQGPSNEDVLAGSGLTVAAARPIVADNFSLVWPEPVTIDPGAVDVSEGCRSKMTDIAAAGPPWRPRYEQTVVDPPQEFIDRALTNLAALTTRGFTLTPSQNPAQDPMSKTYTDSRGFSVASWRETAGPKREVRFSITATAPCAAE